jgi:hypothetical protein
MSIYAILAITYGILVAWFVREVVRAPLMDFPEK